ncbi:MAG TPA: hypothetical protein VGM98_20895 [Schlesneria sp.]
MVDSAEICQRRQNYIICHAGTSDPVPPESNGSATIHKLVHCYLITPAQTRIQSFRSKRSPAIVVFIHLPSLDSG